jgi:hypothetical protein
MSVDTGNATLIVTPAVLRPVMRRDVNNVVVRLDGQAVLALVHELTREFTDTDAIAAIYLTVEGGDVYPQEVFD